eukprot:1714375-Rhodomonas_salina.3
MSATTGTGGEHGGETVDSPCTRCPPQPLKMPNSAHCDTNPPPSLRPLSEHPPAPCSTTAGMALLRRANWRAIVSSPLAAPVTGQARLSRMFSATPQEAVEVEPDWPFDVDA